ncbi:tyrosine-type recombinase/integrase [Prosthecobacter sp.]|uniref:tyrosine-type recombinase/integrase n=1 Tax=Prosthecobacter sp. TaxID=1965333 RepID=UPI003783A60A
MASLWKHPESKFFFACFTDRTGRRLKRSTRETNRANAQKIADGYELAARQKQTVRQIRTVIGELHKTITGQDVATLTFREHCDNWLAEKKGTAPATLVFYRGSVKKFLTFLGERADSDISEIDAKTILAYRNELITLVSPKTVNHDMKTVKALFKAARRDHLLVDDPTEFIETVKGRTEANRRPFTMEEVKRVLAIANDEWRSMILFGLYTGLRISDVAMLRWCNVDLEKKEITIIVQKTGKSLILPIAAPLASHLESIPSSDDPRAPLHPKANGTWEREGRTGRLGNQFSELLIDAGLRKPSPNASPKKGQKARRETQELSFHCLRHTAISLMKEAGIPESVVMAIVGHSSKEVSARYTHVGSEAMQKAADALPDIMLSHKT